MSPPLVRFAGLGLDDLFQVGAGRVDQFRVALGDLRLTFLLQCPVLGAPFQFGLGLLGSGGHSGTKRVNSSQLRQPMTCSSWLPVFTSWSVACGWSQSAMTR